jgi:hypothetical protein
LEHLLDEPAGFHVSFLSVGAFPVPCDDHDLLAPEACQVGTVAQFLPSHGRDGLHVLAVQQHLVIPQRFRVAMSSMQKPISGGQRPEKRGRLNTCRLIPYHRSSCSSQSVLLISGRMG